MLEPRVVRADNPGPFTLDGTRTYIVGVDDVVVVDPGPDDESHSEAVAQEVLGARRVHVLVTHHHPDHAGGAPALARRLGTSFSGPGAGADKPLAAGDRWTTDAGELVAVAASGHSPDHVVFHWPEAEAVFVGDVILGEGETTWVGEYPGCVADYLESLNRIEALSPRRLYSAHGPPVEDPAERIRLFRRHRLDRIRQVEELAAAHPSADAQELTGRVYGAELPEALRAAAVQSVQAILHHLESGERHPGEG